MMRAILISYFLLLSTYAFAQQGLAYGEKPDIKVSYISGEPSQGNPMLVEFFTSRTSSIKERVATLNAIASQYSGQISVLAISRDERSAVEQMIREHECNFSVAIDQSDKTFKNFKVQYVPFAVLLDSKGRVVWSGNPSKLNQTIFSGVE